MTMDSTNQTDTGTPDKDSLLLIRLILTFQTAAMQQMGKIEDPIQGKIDRNLAEASISIDTLNMIRTKCKGNLTDEEERFINHVVSELQLNYIDEMNHAEKEENSEQTIPPDQESGQQQEKQTN